MDIRELSTGSVVTEFIIISAAPPPPPPPPLPVPPLPAPGVEEPTLLHIDPSDDCRVAVRDSSVEDVGLRVSGAAEVAGLVLVLFVSLVSVVAGAPDDVDVGDVDMLGAFEATWLLLFLLLVRVLAWLPLFLLLLVALVVTWLLWLPLARAVLDVELAEGVPWSLNFCSNRTLRLPLPLTSALLTTTLPAKIKSTLLILCGLYSTRITLPWTVSPGCQVR